MDSLSVGVQQALIFLIYSSLIMLIIITVFLVKLLHDMSTLARSLNDISVVLKRELQPTLDELKKTLNLINSVASNADKHVDNFKDTLMNFVAPTAGILGKAKGLTAGLLEGVIAGIRLFSKAKK